MVLPWRYDTSNGPAVMAHRGASADYAEHTLAAYQRALDVGADGVEADVRMTADGHLVCVHDRRIDRVSTGTGVVSASTLAQLQRHDFGSWWIDQDDDEVPGFDEERHTVLTLERLLELVADAARPIRLLIETKHPTRYGGYLERRVVQTLQRYGLARPPRDGTSAVVVMSFSEIAVRRMRQLAPGVPRVMLIEERIPMRMRNGYLPYQASIAGPSIDLIRRHPEYVARLHRAGHQVYVWIVDRMDDVTTCAELGVDAIITNRPGPVLQHLHRTGVRS